MASSYKLPLIPLPRECERIDSTFTIPVVGAIQLAPGTGRELEDAARLLQRILTEHGINWDLRDAGPAANFVMTIEPATVGHHEGYHLKIDSSGIRLIGNDAHGLFYGIQTLRQLLRIHGSSRKIPGVAIRDWPDFPMRGFELDISRNKVPTMRTLRALVDRLSEWKFNQFQLYTEHTFAYRDHEEVWREASPMRPEQIRELDSYCREHYIELVPNQNSFGHMERWLKHPAYHHLAENPEKLLTLAPTDESVQFMSDLYRELLPNFSSRLFNIGCDETWDLGTGLSKEDCERRGKGRVYLDYLTGLARYVRGLDRRPMFWGDIILKYPELIPDVPAGSIALLWGYEAHQPLDDEVVAFAAAGIPFYLCPGTSSWHSLIGRAESWQPNIARATRLAKKHGAEGLLLTEWGDNGHWQHNPVMLMPMAWGAAHAWFADGIGSPEELIDAVSLQALEDSTKKAARGLLGLSMAQGSAERVRIHNTTPLSMVLLRPKEALPENLTTEVLERIEGRIIEAMRLVEESTIGVPDAALIRDEIRNGAALARHAARLAKERIAAGGAVENLRESLRAELEKELQPIIEELRRIWLERNRIGGLEESVSRFEPLRALYRAT